MDKSNERAILAGFSASRLPDELHSTDETLDELEALAETAGAAVAARMLQSRPYPEPGTLFGEGKLTELRELAENERADFVLFDNELSPVQMKNIEDRLGLPVLDRTGIILDIFADRARSAEGKLQVELAQYRYLLPRLAGQGKNLSRQTSSGGRNPIGTRGPGETKLESDRRRIGQRIQKLEADAEEIRLRRGEQRRARLKSEQPLIALAGYTNAGKSTLLNALAPEGDAVHTADRLFDTLDPTTRAVAIGDNQSALLTDTVGFIRDLPHCLVNAFRATLEELEYADLVLHVIDAADPRREQQAAVTDSLLDSLCSPGTKRIYVFNKCDLCRPDEFPPALRGAAFVSAATGEGLPRLRELIAEAVGANMRSYLLKIPYASAALADKLYKSGLVRSAEYGADAIMLAGSCPERVYEEVLSKLK